MTPTSDNNHCMIKRIWTFKGWNGYQTIIPHCTRVGGCFTNKVHQPVCGVNMSNRNTRQSRVQYDFFGIVGKIVHNTPQINSV